MTAKEYLQQAYKLDQRINHDLEEVARLREMATSLSSPSFGERVQSSPDGNAAFVTSVEAIIKLEQKINKEIDLLVALKEQIHDVLSRVSDTDEYIVLWYRYVDGLSWERISLKTHVSVSTTYKRHAKALKSVVLPDNPICIKKPEVFLKRGSKLQ